eukprot:311068_1
MCCDPFKRISQIINNSTPSKLFPILTMSFRNLFKNKKKNKGKSANDFFASTSKPLLSNQLSLSKPTQTNVIETDYDKNSPSEDTPLTPMIHFNDSMPDTKP